jgi:hypothetical protein
MPFAIVVYFDPATEEIIHENWRKLAEREIDTYLYQSENRPHIKLEMFENIDLGKCKERIKEISKRTKKIDIIFKNIGILPLENPVIFLGPTTTKELLSLQYDVINATSDISQALNPEFFLPGLWTPDCQLTVRISKGKLLNAIYTAIEIPIPMNSIISEIGVLEYHPAKKLFAYSLE